MKPGLEKFYRKLRGVCVALAVAGAAYYLLRYQAAPAYREWSSARTNALARELIAGGDARNALLAVRNVLSKRPNNAEALRLGVRAADQLGSAEAVLYQKNLCQVERTPANQIGLIRLALKYGIYSVALETIPALAKEARRLPEYHRLAAETYRRVHQEAAAKPHLVDLLALTPSDQAAQVALAQLEFDLDPRQLPFDWDQRVDRLAADPRWRLPAVMLQLRRATVRRSGPEAAALAAQLLPRTDLDLGQRLYLVEAADLYDPPAADAMRAAILLQVAGQPDEVVQTMKFLCSQSRFDAVRKWYPVLSDRVRQDDRVKLAAAEALQSLRDWPGLEQLLRGPPWKTGEQVRLGLLAEVYRVTDRPAEMAVAWKLAVSATGQDVRKVIDLLQRVDGWHWDEERYDLLWKLFDLLPGNAAVRQTLAVHEFRKGNTANLNKIFARILEVNPQEEDAGNNFAYTSLLLNTNPVRARQIARELAQRHPDNSAYLTTEALALHKQGHSDQALELLEKQTARARATPGSVLHEAVCAAAVGQLDRADRLLQDLPSADLLPEERGLVAEARLTVARAEARRGQGLLAGAIDRRGPKADGWLALLPARPRPAAADVPLSDYYYRERKFPALQDLLHGERWSGDEHLRFALLAYAERAQAGTTAGDYWRQACSEAGRDAHRLLDLEALTARWNWEAENIAVNDRLFALDVSNRARLTKLLDYYRRSSRAPDLARLCRLYVNQTNSNGAEAAWCVYYSLLCGVNVTFAQTLADRIYSLSPQDAASRMVYAFSLWRQHRAREAWPVIQDMDEQALAGMQVLLVQAGVLIELGRMQEARIRLAKFAGDHAMPEEIALAETLSRKVGLANAVVVSNTK